LREEKSACELDEEQVGLHTILTDGERDDHPEDNQDHVSESTVTSWD
jgi:hypothetical protein